MRGGRFLHSVPEPIVGDARIHHGSRSRCHQPSEARADFVGHFDELYSEPTGPTADNFGLYGDPPLVRQMNL